MSGKTTDQGMGCLALIGNPAKTLARLWRGFVITLAWVLFALGCLLLAALTLWVKLRHHSQLQRVTRMRQFASTFASAWMTYCRAVGAIDVHMINVRILPAGLVVANHPSLVDAIWIIATQPNICCVLKGDLESAWLFRYLRKSLDYVSNHDPQLLLEEGCKRLAAGQTLLVFPEATRTAPNTLPQFRLGAAELAVRSQVAVHPIVIHKPGAYLSKGIPWHAFPPSIMRWDIVFCESLPPLGNLPPRQARRTLTAKLQDFFHQQLSAAAVAHRRDDPQN